MADIEHPGIFGEVARLRAENKSREAELDAAPTIHPDEVKALEDEVDALKVENDGLKAEIVALKAELEVIFAKPGTPPPPVETKTEPEPKPEKKAQ